MNEVQVQIDTLLEKRIELKNQIKELLNYGNVPDENWNKIEDLTIKLNSLSYSIELFQETQLAIKQNKGSRNSRKFKCVGCGMDRPCFVETNQEQNPIFGCTIIDDLKCILDETNQTSFSWVECE